MSTAPHVDIDVTAFWHDPYPTFAMLRANAPIAYIPQLGSTVFAAHDDIAVAEKNIAVFSSEQPDGLMTRLMGHNMMRKDGAPHRAERKASFPAFSPTVVKSHWMAEFQTHADAVIDRLLPLQRMDLLKDFALPYSGECLKSITGLTNITYAEIDAWSQAMIDGISNYTGNSDVEARCHAATAKIDGAITDMMPVLRKCPNHSLLSILMDAGMAEDSIRANIKLSISGGQNEPRDAIAGAAWALLTHPDQLDLVRNGQVTWLNAFEEYARWISPIGMSPRRIAKPHSFRGIEFHENDRIFFLFASANRDEKHFERADRFDVRRDTSLSIAFGAGPHFCAGAWASRAMIADIALPTLFSRLAGLKLPQTADIPFGGWAFRGPLKLPVEWGSPSGH